MDSSRCPRYRGRIIHIGCGDQRLDGFVNLDARQTSATDLVHSCDDLSFLPTHSFATIYSHAFFEHLFIFQREPCLRSAHRALKEDGTLVFLGLPDFRAIARAYLDGEPGVTLPRFDLREVYRYTHGQPEHAPDWWLEQLHKSLFDQETVTALLKAAGFNDFCIFNYCFRQEPLPLNLGFIAYKAKPQVYIDEDYVAAFVTDYTQDVNPESITALTVESDESMPMLCYASASAM